MGIGEKFRKALGLSTRNAAPRRSEEEELAAIEAQLKVLDDLGTQREKYAGAAELIEGHHDKAIKHFKAYEAAALRPGTREHLANRLVIADCYYKTKNHSYGGLFAGTAVLEAVTNNLDGVRFSDLRIVAPEPAIAEVLKGTAAVRGDGTGVPDPLLSKEDLYCVAEHFLLKSFLAGRSMETRVALARLYRETGRFKEAMIQAVTVMTAERFVGSAVSAGPDLVNAIREAASAELSQLLNMATDEQLALGIEVLAGKAAKERDPVAQDRLAMLKEEFEARRGRRSSLT